MLCRCESHIRISGHNGMERSCPQRTASSILQSRLASLTPSFLHHSSLMPSFLLHSVVTQPCLKRLRTDCTTPKAGPKIKLSDKSIGNQCWCECLQSELLKDLYSFTGFGRDSGLEYWDLINFKNTGDFFL